MTLPIIERGQELPKRCPSILDGADATQAGVAQAGQQIAGLVQPAQAAPAPFKGWGESFSTLPECLSHYILSF